MKTVLIGSQNLCNIEGKFQGFATRYNRSSSSIIHATITRFLINSGATALGIKKASPSRHLHKIRSDEMTLTPVTSHFSPRTDIMN